MENKKGQEMSVTTLILIVLGIAILVVIIVGFVMGWGNLADKLNIYRVSTSIDDLVTSCNFAVTQTGAFCEFKLVTLDGKKQYVNCEYEEILNRVSGAAPSCGDKTPKSFCEGKTDATIVNGGTCAELKAS